jgi:TorA maturation chaperone TorD
MTPNTLSVPLPELAETRLAVYRFLLAALDKPTPEQHTWFAGPDFRLSLTELCESFGVAPLVDEAAADGPAEHQARYIACFEVGLPAPPVALLASHYNRREPVTAIIHEHILFYRRFGTSLAAGNIEPADHLLNELAFLIRLDELCLQGGAGTTSLVQARRDFLRRQAARWPARAAEAATESRLPAVYRTLIQLLAAAVAQDLELTDAAIEKANGDNS